MLCGFQDTSMTSRREAPDRPSRRGGRALGFGRAGDRKGIIRLAFVSAIGAAVRRERALARLLAAPVLLSLGFAPSSTESAVANGDTRTISLSNSHTNESGSFTYMVDGVYDSAVLEKLNWFLRDWRLNEPTKMDPKLFDIVWEVYRESGSSQPIDVLSGYRSPQTNAMLRRRSRQVAEHSQHMEGKAIDAHFVDVGTATIRDVAMRMQAGGVGFYPTGATPWVHIDSGSVRYWPRMSRDALARLFPDGKTVFIPADGQPMPGYEQARAEIEERGGEVLTARAGGRISACCRGCSERAAAAPTTRRRAAATKPSRRAEPAAGRAARAAQVASAAADLLAAAKRDLPHGATFMQPAEPAARDAASRRFARFERAERREPDQPARPDRGAIHRPRAAAQARRPRRDPTRRRMRRCRRSAPPNSRSRRRRRPKRRARMAPPTET